MHIALTHEQADFDAIASLLGAYLFDETIIPVLPRRMNRNVRAYINLYGVDLPFIDPRDLPSGIIERVMLVDTQSMISLKGMTPTTKVHVVDHHPRREDLPSDWEATTEVTGATVTLFVEGLQERNGILNTVQATLLLLGIYEDTGSLTYTRTTPRDIHAAAYLLEHNASLQIAADFLNHPLSSNQQALYEQMSHSAETLHIHGYTIVIAQGDAQAVEEELSTVAHKMRDLLDPDGLFIIATTRGGVQLIARSTCDNIDVAKIAEYFGGGGHERASASLVKDQNIESVYAELRQILPSYVRPAITVSQIMSRSPQLLSPETPVGEAAHRMQRFGYEGYPVVKNGKVIGLLTRRAVDRALTHKLNLTAASLMDAGSHTVSPEDSIEHLQHIMTETGWGQIPVQHPESGRIIGIVTRTDVLKILTPQPKISGRLLLSERLENVLPTGRLALLKAVAMVANQQRAALYIVGGFVRDLLLEFPSLDYDLVVEGDAIHLANTLAQLYGGHVTSHTRFSTAKWHIKGIRTQLAELLSQFIANHPPEVFSAQPPLRSIIDPADIPDAIDLISARTEFYTHPTALPTVERGSIKLDLHRRDFTINTLALRLDGHHYGELQDYWGGLTDLKQGVVRVLHSLSFIDDPTRILRAIRFEQRFKFHINARTLELLLEARSLLGRVSGDRIRHELDYILAEPCTSAIFTRLQELKILSCIHKDLYWDEGMTSRIEALQGVKPESPEFSIGEYSTIIARSQLIYLLWLIPLAETNVRGVIERLKFPRNLAIEILAACRLWHYLPQLTDKFTSQIVAVLDEYPTVAIKANYLTCQDHKLRSILHQYLMRWKSVTPSITGHHLQVRGIPPGPIYRQILAELRAAWLDGGINTPQEEEAFLNKLISRLVSTNESKKG